MGMATLTVFPTKGENPVDLQVTWINGYDVDASIGVPTFLKDTWDQTANLMIRHIRAGKRIEPYPTLPFGVTPDKLSSSATGLYAIAQHAFDSARWKVAPPYPDLPPLPPGAIA